MKAVNKTLLPLFTFVQLTFFYKFWKENENNCFSQRFYECQGFKLSSISTYT